MSKSTIAVTIEHDGEHCGECRFLRYKFGGRYWCSAFDNVGLWSCGDKAKRCDECVRQAVPVERQV